MDILLNKTPSRLSKRQDLIFLLMLLLVLFWFLRQMWDIGFTTADDVGISEMTSENLLNQLRGLLSSKGGLFEQRPTFFFSRLMNYLRTELFGYSHLGFRLSTILPIIIEVSLYLWLFYLLFQSKTKSILMAVILFASMQHAWTHHTLTAYIFNFHIAFSLVLASACLAYVSFKTLNFRLSFLSGLLFSLACIIYELFAAYALLFPGIFVLCYFRNFDVRPIDRKYLKPSAACITSGLAPMSICFSYLALGYLSPYRSKDYTGTMPITTFSWSDYFNSVSHFSKVALPGKIFDRYRWLVGDYWGIPNITGFELNITSLTFWPIWTLIALIGGISICKILTQDKTIAIKRANLLVLFILSFLFIALPNSLAPLAQGHQKRHLLEATYSGSYFSIFGWTTLLGTIGVSLNLIPNRVLKMVLIAAMSILGAKSIYKAQISNSAIANLQALQYSRWRLLEEFYYNDNYFLEAINSGKILRTDTSMYGKGDQYWGLFHPWFAESDTYWYNFTKNSIGKHLPIFVSDQSCLKLYGTHCLDSRYTLTFHLDYEKKTGTLTFCDTSKSLDISCTHRIYKARL